MNAHPTLAQSAKIRGGLGASNQEIFSQRGSGLVQVAQNTRNEGRLVGGDGELCGALAAQPRAKQQTYLWSLMPQNSGKDFKARERGVTQPLTSNPYPSGDQGGDVVQHGKSVVRRLTPIECERLQGFPDNYTAVPFGRPRFDDQVCGDGHRYKALGNSMSVNVIRWLGMRIQIVDDLIKDA